MTIGFGIIGCGMIARFHAKAVADIQGAKVVACFDSIPAAADKYAAEIGCKAYHNLDDMLADPTVNLVTIGTPSGSHMEPAVAAAKAGKNVVVEKPLEVTLARCDAIIEACQTAKVKLATVFPSRFHGSSQLMKQALDQGRLGKLTLGDAYVKWYRTQQYYDSGAWRGTWALDGGGALMNQAIHSVDLLLWFMGPVAEVTAHAATLAHERIEVEDVVVATVKFASGALGVIEATTAAFPGELKRIEIHGDQGSIGMREEDIVTWKFANETSADERLRTDMASKTQTGGGAADPKAIGHHGHTALFKDMVDAIQNHKPLMCDGAEGRRSVELILAIYKAAEMGKAVQLPLAGDPVLEARRRSSASRSQST
jgi:UDP-N-acetyl-2-amino-2-deoxyglucuronate dehydrogenase